MRIQPIKPTAYRPNLKGIPRPLKQVSKQVSRLTDVKFLQFYNRVMF